jgi:cell filamentation protein
LYALTKELDEPGKGHLDAYLEPFVREALTDDRLAEEIVQTPGLDGNDEGNEVLDKTSDPALKARYEQQVLKRRSD